jgi:hypothetical protein
VYKTVRRKLQPQERNLMDNVASARINTFGTSPKADIVPPENPILEIPLSEFQGLLEEMVLTHNQIAEMIRDAGILRGRELSKMVTRASDSLKATRAPMEKLQLLNAYIRQLLVKVREALKNRPEEGRKIIQVLSKIQARAIQIVDYIKTTIQDDPLRRKVIALDSQQARILFSGSGGEAVSRKETIRAMRRAEALWPALNCGHRPNDGRQTTRLTAKVEELKDAPIMGYRDLWQRSDRRVALNL